MCGWDVAVNRRVASKMLSKYGVVAETVDGGKKALERLGGDHGIDAVLMDIQMPEVRFFPKKPHLALYSFCPFFVLCVLTPCYELCGCRWMGMRLRVTFGR